MIEATGGNAVHPDPDARDRIFQAIIDNTPAAIYVKDRSGTIIVANEGLAETLGVPVQEIIGKTSYDSHPPEVARAHEENDQQILQSAEPQSFEEVAPGEDGDRTFVSSKFRVTDDQGQVIGVGGVSTEITDLKRIEAQLVAALTEKDDLMRELNHRVKNNLAMVSALVSLKEHALGGTVDLSDIRSRLNAILAVHEKLALAQNQVEVAVRSYLEEFLETLFSSLSDIPIQTTVDAEDLHLSARTTSALGLIVNEAATNAVKYGFDASEPARFEVAAFRSPDGERIIVRLRNNGRPMPETVSLDNPDTLGMRLIASLAQQLEGTARIEHDPPTIHLEFPADQ